MFNEQHEIGWQQFREGFITFRWAHLQHEYYKSIGSRRSGKVWAKELIRQLWKINYAIWHFRNTTLHENKQLLDELEGRPVLLLSIRAELTQGLDGFHHNLQYLFDQFATTNVNEYDTHSLKLWFRHIRSLRETKGTDRQDSFSHKGSLRSWVGLK